MTITPTDRLRPLSLLDRGEIIARRAIALISHLSSEIARRELKVLGEKLGWNESVWQIEEVTNSPGPGNVLFVEIETPRLTEVFTGFGERGIRAEAVAGRFVRGAGVTQGCSACLHSRVGGKRCAATSISSS